MPPEGASASPWWWSSLDPTYDLFDGWREFGNRCRQFNNRRRDSFDSWREFGNHCRLHGEIHQPASSHCVEADDAQNRRQGTCTERYANLLHHTVLKQTMCAFDGGRRRRSRTIKRTCFIDGRLTAHGIYQIERVTLLAHAAAGWLSQSCRE